MANEKVLGLVSGTRDGKLLVVTTPTRCDDPATGEVYMGLVSGTRNGKPLVAISTQRCDPNDELTNGQTYLGLVSGTRNGKPLLVVPCGDCAEPSCCNCENLTTGAFPATLPFTVTDSCFGVWSGDLVDTTASFSGGYCVPGFGPTGTGSEVAAAYVKSELTTGGLISTGTVLCNGSSIGVDDVLEYDKRDLLVLCNRIRCDDLITVYHIWSVWYRRELINTSTIKLVNGVKVLGLLSCDPLTFESEMEWTCYMGTPSLFPGVPNSPIDDPDAYCDTFDGISEPQYTVYQNCEGGTVQIDIG